MLLDVLVRNFIARFVLEHPAAVDIAAERHRQVEVEGFSPAHDAAHADGAMAGRMAVLASEKPSPPAATAGIAETMNREARPPAPRLPYKDD